MATLIAAYNSEGCVGRCDAKCYDAKGGACDCICGGKNHGVGRQRAVENTQEMAEQWIDAYNKIKGQKLEFAVLPGNTQQLALF